MAARRAFLTGIAVATAGCLDAGDSSKPSDSGDDRATPTDRETEEDPSYHLRAAPVTSSDREPVLSTETEAVAEIEPLLEVIVEVTQSFEVSYTSLSAAEAEAFEEVTADTERYVAGNPPGYYIEHEGWVISVTLGGG
jgi:hypothetical protein